VIGYGRSTNLLNGHLKEYELVPAYRVRCYQAGAWDKIDPRKVDA